MLLYVDTESDPITKRPISVQWATQTESGVITEFTHETYKFFRSLWFNAEAVVFFNAPYDMGVLSIAWASMNSYKWVDNKSGQYWFISVCGHPYRVRRIGGFRNLIKGMPITTSETGETLDKKKKRPHATPVIDLLKLWSILVDDGSKHSISLKALIERELHTKAIHYTPETAQTLEYQLQDVEKLRELWQVFLDKVSNIEAIADYSYADWAYAKTPATFTKLAYEAEYPDLKAWQDMNLLEDERFKLSNPLESAYHGGITIALKRGISERSGWFDIHGAYAHVIEYENTDQYLRYHWEPVNPDNLTLGRDNAPMLCKCKSTAVIASLNASLKIYKVNRPASLWLWSYDILMLGLLFPEAEVSIEKAYRLIPELHMSKSLPAKWSEMKEEEEALHGKTTRREFFKFLSNTSYGIKAQRKPYTTKHTNMAIAGLITARAHLILAEMIDESRLIGCRWVYSDTDSICIEHDKQDMCRLEDDINKRITPYSAGCEGYDRRTKILSLKRYTSTGGINTDGSKPKDKIRLHGKGQYKITTANILSWTEGEPAPMTPLKLASVAGNTFRTLNRVISLNPLAATFAHPFMFETGVKSDKSASEWFNDWFAHVDTKTTYKEGALVTDEFYREFRTFETNYHASSFYNSKIISEEEIFIDKGGMSYSDDMDTYFYDSVPASCISEVHS